MRVRPGAGDRVRRLRRVGRARRRAAGRSGPRSTRRRARTGPGSPAQRIVHVLAALAGRCGHGVEVEEAPEQRPARSSAAVSRIARVPFVVEKITVSARGSPRNSRGDAPTSKPSIRTAFRSPPRRPPQLLLQRERLLDLGAAVDALVARRQRLGDRRGRAQDVHDDADRSARRLRRRKRDVDAHPATTLPPWRRGDDVLLPAPEPGDRRLLLRVRPRRSAPDCMVFAPVGIRCPDHAGRAQGAARVTTGVRRAAYEGTGALVTKALIALNVLVFLVNLAQGSSLSQISGSLFVRRARFVHPGRARPGRVVPADHRGVPAREA